MPFDISDFRDKLQKSFDHIVSDIATLRTGRASAQMLDPVSVSAYGTMMKVHEVANVSTPDPTLIMISPWDKSLVEAIEKAIATSPLNLHPIVDGDLIRISVPPLTEERRKELVKVLQQKIEAGMVMLRNLRTDVKKDIEKQKGEEGISEDDIEHDLDNMESEFKTFTEKLETLSQEKEKELLTV